MAFRGINCKTSVKVDDTLALQKSFKIDYLLFILDPTSPVCWLWSWPVCGWGWDLSVQGRSGGGRGQTQLLSGKQMCILWKFLLLCGIQVTKFFFWLFLKMTISIIIIIFVLLVTLNWKRNFMKIWKKKIMNYQKEIKEHFQIRFSITYPKMWE